MQEFNLTIREFRKEDSDSLLEVLKEVWSISKIEKETLEEWMLNNFNFVAEFDGQIVGTITLHTQKKLIRNGAIAGFIEDVAVKEEYRGKKIGSELVKVALNKAREIGCYKVILSCFDERVNFYRREGFVKECNTMRFNF